ncbi:Hypothetical protein SMAX5B_019354 [Scophthalmus maximus]|uniref:Uncharacterized protein n=1 Tax=Scophthalmus maximus TaxID=52904 RepID=A0A2U9BWB8_SCOMX|nr:Hypothetical protein SMAX5B_019354 [Scophthalmus maximus]
MKTYGGGPPGGGPPSGGQMQEVDNGLEKISPADLSPVPRPRGHFKEGHVRDWARGPQETGPGSSTSPTRAPRLLPSETTEPLFLVRSESLVSIREDGPVTRPSDQTAVLHGARFKNNPDKLIKRRTADRASASRWLVLPEKKPSPRVRESETVASR